MVGGAVAAPLRGSSGIPANPDTLAEPLGHNGQEAGAEETTWFVVGYPRCLRATNPTTEWPPQSLSHCGFLCGFKTLTTSKLLI